MRKTRPWKWVMLPSLAFALLLAGCPKRPEVGAGQAGAMGPQATTPTPAPTPSAAGPVAPTPATKPPEEAVKPPAGPTEAAVQPGAAVQPKAAAAVKAAESPLKDVFFDFDKSLIREDQKAALNDDAAWLKANAAAKVTIEGHCDERGTAEYNLALGERRAKAVRDYLVAAGIDPSRLSTISYGKERPFVLGHDESAWRWNRRGHFVVK